MDKLYKYNGDELSLAGKAEYDAMMVDVNNVVSLATNRVTKLEGMHNEFLMPVLRLSGDLSKMTKEKAVNLDAEYTDGVRSFKCIAKTKLQGRNSLNFPKKNFNIKFIDANKNKVTMSFKDWFPTNGFHVKGNYQELSMVRNVVGVRLGRDAYPNLYPNNAKGVVDFFHCVLYINDEFWGCYTWNLPQDKRVFAMDETNDNHLAFRCDNTGWDLEYFEDRVRDETTPEQLEKFARMVNWTKTCTVEEFANNVEDYFDLDALRYYWVYIDIALAVDNMVNNSTWATWDGTHWYPLLYDMDICFGYGQAQYPANTDMIAMSKTEQYAYKYNPIWDKLYQTDYTELCKVYAELREKYFSDAATIINYFTSCRNKWGTTYLDMEYQKWGDYRGEPWASERIELCGPFITDRLAYCDNKYGYTPGS